MKKQYKIQLPKGKKVTMTNVNFEGGVMTVNVELENESTFGRIAAENLDKAAKERINEHDKQIDKILKMEDDKDVRTVANMILQEYGENIRWKKQQKCMRTLREQKLIDEIDTSISKRAKELREIFDIKAQSYEPKDGEFIHLKWKGIKTLHPYEKEKRESIAIFKEFKNDLLYCYITYLIGEDFKNRPVFIPLFDNNGHKLSNGYTSTFDEIRPATEKEKKLLIDQLAKVNKKWNPETKAIEDVR